MFPGAEYYHIYTSDFLSACEPGYALPNITMKESRPRPELHQNNGSVCALAGGWPMIVCLSTRESGFRAADPCSGNLHFRLSACFSIASRGETVRAVIALHRHEPLCSQEGNSRPLLHPEPNFWVTDPCYEKLDSRLPAYFSSQLIRGEAARAIIVFLQAQEPSF